MLQTLTDETRRPSEADRSAAPLTPWRGLTGQFTLAALAIIVNGMTLLGVWTARQIESGVIEHSVANAALHFDSFVEPHIQDLVHSSEIADSAAEALTNLIRQQHTADHIVGVRLWSPALKQVWPKANAAPDPDVLARVSKVSQSSTPETAHLFSIATNPATGKSTPMLHIFAPMHKTGTTQLIAIAELIETATDLKRRVDQSRLETALAFLLLATAMFVPLVAIVQRGSKTISEQREALADRVQELAEHLGRIAQLQDRLVEAQARSAVVREKTLRRIGADLHDGPIQSLAVALLNLDNMRSDLRSAPTPEHHALETLLRDTMADMRQLSAGLFLPDLEGRSIGHAIDVAVVNHERRTRTRVTTEFGHGVETVAPMLVLACVYRFVQEGLTNAKRHADGLGQRVEAFIEGQILTVSVSDSGPGMKEIERAISELEGLGLIGMRDRLETIGGRLAILQNEPTGVKLIAYIDLTYSSGDELREIRSRY